MHRCRHGKAPQYLVDCCTRVTDVVGRQPLRSATQQMMVVPRHRLSTVGRRAFAVQSPMVWYSLPDDLRAQQDYESFRQHLKTWLSPATSVPSALETSWQLRYVNSHLPLSLPLQEVWSKLKRAVKQHMVETETKRCDYTRGPCSPCLVQSVPEWTASVMQVLSFPHNSLPKTHYRHSSSTASHLSQHTINIGTLHTATLIDWARFNVPPNTL